MGSGMHIDLVKWGGQKRSVACQTEVRRLISAVHVTAALLRFWMNMKGYGVGGSP